MNNDPVYRFANLAYLAYRATSSDILPPGFDDDLEKAANKYEDWMIRQGDSTEKTS